MMPIGHPQRDEQRYNDHQDDWTGTGEKCVSGAWRRREGCHETEEAVTSQTDAAFLLEAATVPDRDVGVRNSRLLGSHAAAMGHEVRLIPPSYLNTNVKRGKSDALDAEAICEAVHRRTMRFVPVKTVEQRSILMAHRAHSLFVRQRTMRANALRAHLAEVGLVTNPGSPIWRSWRSRPVR